ncbi:hypothetical protein BS50DRAFT_109317 [Corynespora cassiicola Philippines]|uniref:Uncharacterized protein n=1 Tax=Corynespora cassiicola Philippines TaxID=1448308 RepID=A0A2T2ND48_CORCC|nr:hypothetical protein BS50DRAFT_109317 [Corynespora cassiicola Philippines]
MAPNNTTKSDQRSVIWNRVYPKLLKHAVADSRFSFDFLKFVPDFQGSSSAVDSLVQLPCYQSAKTLLVTPDNSLEGLRFRALKDGKNLLVATHQLRRGFVLLNPNRIPDEQYQSASWLDGMERPGIGRNLTLSQLQNEGVKIDLSVIGGLAFSTQGVIIWEGPSLFEVQWAMLLDTKSLSPETPVIAVAHDSQVVDEKEEGLEETKPAQSGEVQCDFLVTPGKTYDIKDAVKSRNGIDFEKLDQDALNNIPPLQELKGIRMMESIMKGSGFGKEEKEPERTISEEEQMGMSIVDKLMKGFKF